MKSNGKKFEVEAVLLDLDGTVVDSRAAYLETAKKTFSDFGHNIFDVTAVLEIPRRLEQGSEVDDLVQGIDVKSFLNVYLRRFYEVVCTKSKPFLCVEDALKELHLRVKLGLITLRYVPHERLVAELEAFQLMNYFDIVMTGCDGYKPKPSPEAFIECALELGVTLSHCVVVGDSVVDVRAGKNAGVKTVAVLSGIYSCAELQTEKPDLILENVRLLPDFIDLVSRHAVAYS
jgi:beta-phosphoglucomutase-like phosphatase (HAD superfamily)